MIKMWLIGIVAVIALAVSVQSQTSSPETEAAAATLDQGVEQVDSVLQQGLSPDSYDGVTDKGQDSAKWFVGFGSSLGGAVE